MLKQNIRLSTNGLNSDEIEETGHFLEWILKIGNRDICDLPFLDDQDAVLVRIPYELQLQGFNDPVASMVSCIYPNIERPQVDPSYFKERAIVTPKNIIVSEINDFTFNITQGHLEIYLNTNSVEASFGHGNNTELLYPIEFINQLEFNGVPSHALALKLGTPVMLHRNLNPVVGLCNGTRLISSHSLPNESSRLEEWQETTSGIKSLP